MLTSDVLLREEAAGEAVEKQKQPLQVRHTLAVAAVGAKTEVNMVMPWNLRTRRADRKSPVGGGIGTGSNSANGKGLKNEAKKPNGSPMRTEALKSPDSRACPTTEKIKRPKFSLSLSKSEIEADFMEMIGQRPPRRPKKRARNVQKQLDPLFPGRWLTYVSANFYKVPDAPENGKK